MKVIAAVNDLITSEITAFYALRYAALHGFPLTLLHVENPLDSLDDVERSMAVIKEDRLSVKKFAFFASFAKAYGAATEVYSITRVDSIMNVWTMRS